MSQVVSAPSVRVNDVTWKIVPNTFMVKLGEGETNVRAASAGGSSVESVHTINAETKISGCTFEVYPEPDRIKDIQSIKRRPGGNTIAAIQDLGDNGTISFTLRKVSLTNDPDLNLTSDGTISLEWAGDPVVVG